MSRLNTPDWRDFCDSVVDQLGVADKPESESVAVGWSPVAFSGHSKPNVRGNATATLRGRHDLRLRT